MAAIPVDPRRQSMLVSHCRGAVARGEYELGERICREMNASGWGCAGTWLVISEVARLVGRRDIAIDAVAQAERMGDASRAELASARAASEAVTEVPARAGPVHVIRSWGQGFWSDVDHVIGQLVVAEITGRKPIVLWGQNSRFGDGTDNAWESFFEPVSDGAVPRGGPFFPNKWRDDNLTVAENGAYNGPGSRIAFLPFLASDATTTVSDFHAPLIAVRHWIRPTSDLAGLTPARLFPSVLAAHVRVRGEIVARAEGVAQTLGLGDSPVVAVHVRGSDKVIEMGDMSLLHEAYHEEVGRRLDQSGRDARLLLLTDWQPAVDQFRSKYGGRVIETTSLRTSGTVGLHFHHDRDGRRLGEEVLVDTLLAAKCGSLVGLGWSNVSMYMAYFAKLNGMDDESISLLGSNLHDNYNWALLRRN